MQGRSDSIRHVPRTGTGQLISHIRSIRGAERVRWALNIINTVSAAGKGPVQAWPLSEILDVFVTPAAALGILCLRMRVRMGMRRIVVRCRIWHVGVGMLMVMICMMMEGM